MRNRKLLLTSYFLLFTLVIACGRRGDPVAIMSVEEVATEKAIKDEGSAVTKETGVSKGVKAQQVGPPVGLIAIYTKKSIILTWDEITSQEIKGYNVYRSSGDGYTLIGMTITPAFTDTDVKPNRRYLYRVTVVGEMESPPSQEIEVLTESR